MSAPSLDRESPVSATAVIVMPRGMSAPSAVRKLAVGGLIDAALVDCSAMGESSRPSLSMAQELIAQLVDARGARWVQLIEPGTAARSGDSWGVRPRGSRPGS